MGASVETWSALLLLVSVVGVLARRWHVPYNVGLIFAGAAVALFWHQSLIEPSRDIVYRSLLPPLIFEAALMLDWRALRPDGLLLGMLVTVGVLLSTAASAALMHAGAQWPLGSALILGALLSATDPVFAVALLREWGARGRLARLLEAESLLNDATAAVLFAAALTVSVGQYVGPMPVLAGLVGGVATGAAVGAVCAASALVLIGRTDDHLLEVTLTVVAAYGSFFVAEHFSGSGVLATLVAGALIGEVGRRRGLLSEAGQNALHSTWEFITFVGSSLVFLLVGLAEGRMHYAQTWGAILWGIVAALVGRAAAVYPTAALFRGAPSRLTFAQQNALVWSGFRGALALALALSVPESLGNRDRIVAATFGVVAFSVVCQGLTCRVLLRHALREP